MEHWASKLDIPYTIRWVHNTDPSLVVAVQKLVNISGMAYLCPISYLNIHEEFGPWIAFRAVVIFDDNMELSEPNPLLHPDKSSIKPMEQATQLALANIKDWRSWVNVRDSCNIGKVYRYSQNQILYHYTKDKSVLQQLK